MDYVSNTIDGFGVLQMTCFLWIRCFLFVSLSRCLSSCRLVYNVIITAASACTVYIAVSTDLHYWICFSLQCSVTAVIESPSPSQTICGRLLPVKGVLFSFCHPPPLRSQQQYSLWAVRGKTRNSRVIRTKTATNLLKFTRLAMSPLRTLSVH